MIQPYQGEHDGLTVCAVSGLCDTLIKGVPMMAAMPVISLMALMTVIIRCVRDGLFDYGIRDVHDDFSDSYISGVQDVALKMVMTLVSMAV
jgi:hypothetical protein